MPRIGNVVKTNTKNSLVVSTSRPVVTNGVENMAVIETSDAVLVTELSKCQQVKELVLARNRIVKLSWNSAGR